MADPFPEGRSIICGAKVRVDGRIPANRALLLANHVSWLDISRARRRDRLRLRLEGRMCRP